MTPIWTTRDFSGSNVLASIAFSRAGQKRDCPMRRSCAAVSSALTRSTHFCNGDEGCLVTANNGRDIAPDAASYISGSALLLVEARVYQLRRADRPDRDHANGAGREKEMD